MVGVGTSVEESVAPGGGRSASTGCSVAVAVTPSRV
jgi:hypothetical protein